MKKKGMTLIESVVTIALLGVIFLLVTPLIRSFGRVKGRVYTQNSIDKEFSNVNSFIQKKIRSAKRTGKSTGSAEADFDNDIGYVGVFEKFVDSSVGFFTTGESGNKIENGEKGQVLFLEVPSSSSNSDFVFFYFQDNQLFYQENFNPAEGSGNPTVLMSDIEEGNFRLRDGVVVYYIDLYLGEEAEGKFNDSLRSSSTTRIDLVR